MIAYGTFQVKSAWKLFAKAQDIPFETANEVANQIGNYLEDLRNLEDEDERENLDVYEYISEEHRGVFEKSKIYRGIVASISIHPCALLITNLDIPSEIGLIKVKNNLCCCMDGAWAENYHFLKNDLLTVSVVDFIHKTYERIGIPHHTTRELLKNMHTKSSMLGCI